MAVMEIVEKVPPEGWTMEEIVAHLRGISNRVSALETRLTQLKPPVSEPFEPILEFVRREEAEIDKAIEALEALGEPEEDEEKPTIELEALTREVKDLFI